MAVLLTGGCGYIGSHTAVALIESGYEVILADDFRNCRRDIPKRICDITGVMPKNYDVDVCNSNALRQVFNENSVNGIIHFAGFKAVGESVENPIEYYRNNLDSTLTLLELMKEYGCKNFVFSSSATVYGGDHTMPLTEVTPITDSTNPYGRSKIMNEHILEDAAKAYGLSVVLLRYFNPVGAHPSGLIGEDPNGIPNNLMPFITQVAAGQREKLKVFGNDYPTPDGTGIRDYIHICDLAEGHLKAIEYASLHTGCIAVNLGRGEGISVLQLVKAFEKVNNIQIPYEITKRRQGDVAECWSSSDLAEKLLGWKASRTLDDMCRDSWNWQKNQKTS